MTRFTLNLGGSSWSFGQVPRRPFAAPDVYDLPAVTEWLPAVIPGNVRTDLLALGRILDPFFGEQYKESLWVEEVDWWYRRAVEPPLVSTTSRAFLIFEGIDYLSAIFINGREMAHHEGMFSRQIVEITEALRAGPMEVAVRLWGSSALPKRRLTWQQRLWQKLADPLYRSWIGIYPDRSATLKCQMSFGWDFAPPIRTMGIWDEVSLVVSGPVFIAEANCQSSVAGSQRSVASSQKSEVSSQKSERNARFSSFIPHPSSFSSADLTITLTLDADQPRRVETDIAVTPANFEGAAFGPFHFTLDLTAGQSRHRLFSYLPAAALWQPWDRGQPHLYEVQVSLAGPGGEPLDEVAVRTGIRSVDLHEWQFSINSQREFIRGLNWVPADSFPGRLRSEDYTRLLNMAQDSGANLLRVWGGGLREKQAFYDLCDELGLLVWQEFPFACLFLGSYPRDPAYLALVEAECSAIVQQLGRHPSLVVWCGGNEFSRSRNRPLLDTLAALVTRHDGTRPFIPVSPSFDCGGDAHNWHVWHGQAPIQHYQAETARFLSEFGLQALPHLDTLQAALPDPATGWEIHHADLQKLKRYTSLFNGPSATSHQLLAIYNSPFTIFHSQLAQAIALQTAIEHMRRRKGEAGGVCLWQFNEPWPAISWAIVDYFGRPKLAYERLANWFNPVLISLKFSVGRRWQAGQTFTAEIWAINDSQQAFTACELQVKLDETLIHSQRLDLPADSAQRIGQLTHCLPQPPDQITLTLYNGVEVLAQNTYDLNWADEANYPFSARFRRWVADWALR
ncbi:MAG: hypothetical protein HS126_05540 [Anaerolineales bacterium]|nr:hypothetical protein [Anaerolineales bacterium]